MSSNLVTQINNLSDSDAVLFLQYFNQSVLDGIEDFEAVIDGIPNEIKSMPEFSEIDRLSLDETVLFEGEEAVVLSRQILLLLAENPRLSPILEKAMDSYDHAKTRNLELGAKEEILSGALAAALILLAGTKISVTPTVTEFKYEIPPDAATPVLVAAFAQLSSPLLQYIKKKENDEKAD